jgi:hypothetical protein
MRTRAVILVAVIVVSFWTVFASGRANGRKFYPDDPIRRDPETQNASHLKELPISELYDFAENSFFGAGDHTDTRAVNVNTVDEVPDSSWFTNRLGQREMSIDQLVKGPDTGSGPTGVWTITGGKSEGVQPGFTMRDASGQLYFVKFDPPSNPEMASGAEVIATKFFHAFGYHVPENYIATIRREDLIIGESAQIEDEDGRKHAMKPRHLEALLKKTMRSTDGTYRAMASKALAGKPVGRFRYYGTRPDDPNDIFPHEHRRELRGLLVFAAWLNHDDSRSINTFDSLVSEGGRAIVRHHLLDFGSTLGSGSVQAQSTRAGNEFLWEQRPTFITMLTLGFYVRPWLKVDYPHLPSVGRLEADYFQPDDWKPEYPNPAFANARAEDRFWAARIVAAIPRQAIGAIVESARYTDPRAAEYLTDIIAARRTKVLNAWLNGTNPIVNPTLSSPGVLTFDNAAEDAGVSTRAERYTIEWSRFDNNTGMHTAAGNEQTITDRRANAPAALLSSSPEYVSARLRAFHPEHPGWSHPLLLYFRRTGEGWSLVGLERNP